MDIIQKNIAKELGLENMSGEKRDEIYLRISNIIYKNIMIRVVEVLGEEDQDEFNKLLDTTNKTGDNGGKIFEFLNSKVKNLEDIIVEEITRFKEESADVMQEIKK